MIINVVDGKRYFKGKPYRRKYCTYYNKIGHTVEYCFRKHGFPPSSKFKHQPSTSANNVTGEVEAFDDAGYVEKESQVNVLSIEECRTLLSLFQKTNLHQQPLLSASQGNIDIQEPQVHQACTSKHTNVGIMCNYVESNKNMWILNSGAIDHICTSLDWFETLHRIKPI